MKITYDQNLHVTGIGLVPWTRLGPERWFHHYKIASLYDWDLPQNSGVPEVIALSGEPKHSSTLRAITTSQQLINDVDFQQLLIHKAPGSQLLPYKTLQTPQALQTAGFTIMHANQLLAQMLENKAAFRARFADLDIPFPAYSIRERSTLNATTACLKDILNGREAVILQDEQLSGGRGTFVIRTLNDLTQALKNIEQLGGGQNVVVSDVISSAKERSVQCVVTKYGTFVGPLQKQVINNPLLNNLAVPDGNRFGGAEISPHDPYSAVYPEVKCYAEIIGAELQSMGYRGIFSLDCLIDENGRVFVLEINPRITGITPLVTMLYRDGQDIPFYLLHILELGGFDYKITDKYVSPNMAEGSMLVMHSQHNTPVQILSGPASGLYDLPTMTLQEKAYRINLDTPDRQLLLQQYMPPGFILKPGGRLMTAVVNGAVLDEHEKLKPEITDAVTKILSSTELRKVA